MLCHTEKYKQLNAVEIKHGGLGHHDMHRIFVKAVSHIVARSLCYPYELSFTLSLEVFYPIIMSCFVPVNTS